ncbi:MAG: signal recognition particle protein Srp54 [Halobacteriota archaeon]|nr:signal recognition particle protein Srp54 [Halobacteriota archaeon]
MVLDSLGRSLRDVMRKIARANRIDEYTVNEFVKDIQRALLGADVNVKLVMELSTKIKERSLKEKPAKGANPREHILHIVYQELVNIVGKDVNIPLTGQTILMVGLQGSGKTTSTAKLARYFQKKGLKPGVICADVYRPGAYNQLKQLCEKVGVTFYGEEGGKDAVKIVKNGMKELNTDVKIIDTAGRHSLEKDLIVEMEKINKLVKPDQKFLVLDAALGQGASEQARAFNESVRINGVIITKLDGTAKGGGALSAVSETGSPIAFIGTGETIDDFEPFEADRFISRLLGMGDIKSLIEKAEETFEDEEMDIESMLSGRFTLKDMYKNLGMVNKLGPLRQVMDMLPIGGMGIDIPDEAYQVTKDKLKNFMVIMDSMTDEELEKPSLISGGRIRRIAMGSGTDPEEVRELLKYHKMMKRAMKGLRGGKMGRASMKKLMKGGGFNI